MYYLHLHSVTLEHQSKFAVWKMFTSNVPRTSRLQLQCKLVIMFRYYFLQPHEICYKESSLHKSAFLGTSTTDMHSDLLQCRTLNSSHRLTDRKFTTSLHNMVHNLFVHKMRNTWSDSPKTFLLSECPRITHSQSRSLIILALKTYKTSNIF